MGMLYSLASWPGGVPCWLEKGQGACAPCGVGGQWCGACCWVPGPPGPLVGGGVPFPPSWPCPFVGWVLGWCGVVV